MFRLTVMALALLSVYDVFAEDDKVVCDYNGEQTRRLARRERYYSIRALQVQ